jgi:DNA polymerase family A
MTNQLIDIGLDFETYYDADYSLKKMENAQYVMDGRFESMGFSLKLPGKPAQWITGDYEHQKRALGTIPWGQVRVVSHNARFDGAILEWRFGFKPAAYLCTMVGSRPHYVPLTGSASLDSISQHLKLQAKGTAVHKMLGKHRTDLSKLETEEYGAYCVTDTENACDIAANLIEILPLEEQVLIDLTLKKYLRPRLKLDGHKLMARLTQLDHERGEMLAQISARYSVDESTLRSREKFAEVLRSRGVMIPMKPTKATKKNPLGGQTYAFAKDDIGFKELLIHPDPAVRELCTAKLTMSSSLEQSRLRRLLDLHNTMNGYLPVPMVYYGAHTGRFSGDEAINLQNLPRVERDKQTKEIKKGHLRFALTAPPGYSVVAADFSNIEARIVATLARQTDLIMGFRNSEDIYSKFATSVYGYPVNKKDHETERFVGKTCIAEGTLVLCERGWVAIEKVTIADRVWDGEEWVCHQGLIDNGVREVQQLSGVWLTPDHQLWSGTQWLEAQFLVQDESILSQALDTGAVSLQSLDILSALSGQEFQPLSSSATVAAPNTQYASKILKCSNPRAARNVAARPEERNGIGHTAKQCLIQNIEPDCSIDWRQPLQDAIQNQVVCFTITGVEESEYVTSGLKTGGLFLGMSKHCPDGTTLQDKWIGSITIVDTNLETSALRQRARMQQIKEQWENSKKKSRVYDILSAGPRNRFVVKSDDGALIAHNCILGLGYGMGWRKFLLKMLQSGISMDEAEAKRIVYLYRGTYKCIPDLWKSLDQLAAKFLIDPQGMYEWRNLVFASERIILPNGMPIQYPDIANGPQGLYFRSRKYRALDADSESLNWEDGARIWGGGFCENIAQALARIIATRAELRLHALGLDAVMQAHDELVFMVPTQIVEKCKQVIEYEMIRPVDWMPELPIAVEIKHGNSYGDAK